MGMAKRTKKSDEISVDQAVKDLIADYPLDAWRFLLPDMAKKYGDPISWKDERSETRKTDYHKKGFVMDVPISYLFKGGRKLMMVVLFEHWSTSKSVDIYRTARYVLDLMVRFPDHQVIPVAVVTDTDPGPIPERILLEDPMSPEPFLTFRHRIHKAAEEDLMKWVKKTNVIAGALFTVLKGDLSVSKKALFGLNCLGQANLSLGEELKIASLLFRVGKLTNEQQEEIMAAKAKLPEPHLFKLLKAETKREDARKMLELGATWEFITNVTGILPADLQQNSARPTKRKLAKA